MTSVRFAGLMAGGSGSRLASAGVMTPKPVLEVGGRPLVSYFLDEAYLAGIEHIVAAVRSDDVYIQEFLLKDARFSWEFAPTNGRGTLCAIEALSERLNDYDHIVSTCDVILPPGSLNRLLAAVRELSAADPQLVLLGTDVVHDTNPIWIHADSGDRRGVVTAVGKDCESSSMVFGHVRWVRRGFGSLLRRFELEGITQDTRMLSALVKAAPGSVRVCLERDVADVDTPADVKFVEELMRSSPSYRQSLFSANQQ